MRYLHGEKPKRVWPPPYPAWPEIADPSTLYTLPTLASHPAILHSCWSPRWLGDYFTNEFDNKEKILAKLPPTTKDNLSMAIGPVDLRTMSRGIARAFAMMDIADPEWSAFALDHEIGHFISFGIDRPTILDVDRIATGIFALFKKLTLTACENFWDEFQKGNGTLVTYLDKVRILEELRANFFAFSALDPKIRVSIEPDLRKVMAEEYTISLFDTLAEAMHEDWSAAYWLSIIAEWLFVDEDPIKMIRYLYRIGNDDSSKTPLIATVKGWYRNEWVGQAGWDVELKDSMYRTPKINFTPRNENNEHAAPAARPLSLPDVRELVFLESLRQQLAQFDGASLVCPFQQSGRTCCGFGHYLRAIWEQVPAEYKSVKAVLRPITGKEIVVRPPRKACLNYGLG